MCGPAGDEGDSTSPFDGLLSRPPTPERERQHGNSHQRGGWGAERSAKKVGREGGHGLSRAEVEVRLVRAERASRGSRLASLIPL
jgi:hypothetical protein